MFQSVLMMDTGNPAAHAAARTFLARGAAVYFLCPAPPPQPVPGVQYLLCDPLQEDSLRAAVHTYGRGQPSLDLFLFGAPLALRDDPAKGYDADAVVQAMMTHVYGTRLALEGFLPHLRAGQKRIGHITTVESSNSYSTEEGNIAMHTVLAAQNMLGRMFFNRLRPEGFTFRWYCDDGHPGGLEAAQYMTAALCYDPKEPYTHSDENRMVLRDAYLREIPW